MAVIRHGSLGQEHGLFLHELLEVGTIVGKRYILHGHKRMSMDVHCDWLDACVAAMEFPNFFP